MTFDDIFPPVKDRQLPAVGRQKEAYVEDCPGYFVSMNSTVMCAKYGVVCSNKSCIQGRKTCKTKE